MYLVQLHLLGARRNDMHRASQQHQHAQQSQHAQVKQHAQEHQHACTCSSIANTFCRYAAMYDAISIDVSPHVPQMPEMAWHHSLSSILND